MNKKSNNVFLEVSNGISYDINKDFFIELFRNLEEKSLLIHKERNKLLNDLNISLVIVDDKKIKGINKKYRNKDKVTDVLSFEFLADNDFVLPKDKNILGEIFISYPEAKRKTEELNISLKKELALLFIHGLLHLLGYDHEEDLEEKEMRKKEKIFLNETNVLIESVENI